MPVVFVALIKFGGSGYMDSLYSSAGGYLLMSLALVIIAVSVVISRKIFEIRV
jgi:tight adherence protein B